MISLLFQSKLMRCTSGLLLCLLFTPYGVAADLDEMLPADESFAELPSFRNLVEQAGPAVVNIQAIRYSNHEALQELATATPDDENHRDLPDVFERWFNDQAEGGFIPDNQSNGSGFVVHEDGFIVTNHHVVNGADEIVVRFMDRRELPATLIGFDRPSDIAVLKVESDSLQTLRFSNNESLHVGDWVVAIGSPFNFENSVTTGIVSAMGRNFVDQQYVPFIQTDVPINRGNSGGPLLSLDGAVVGINSQIYSENGNYMGLSFAIPAPVVSSVVQQLVDEGVVRRGLLGVGIEDVTLDLAKALELADPYGAIVTYVAEDSAAQNAGVQPWDVIVAFDGNPVSRFSDLPPLVGMTTPGSESELTLIRSGRTMQVPVTIGALPQRQASNEGIKSRPDLDELPRLGLSLQEIELDSGVVGLEITNIKGIAAYRAGFRLDDVITMINARPVQTVDQFDSQLRATHPGKPMAFLVHRGNGATYVVVDSVEASEQSVIPTSSFIQ